MNLVNILSKLLQNTFPEISDVIFLVYKSEAYNRNYLPFQHAQEKVFNLFRNFCIHKVHFLL